MMDGYYTFFAIFSKRYADISQQLHDQSYQRKNENDEQNEERHENSIDVDADVDGDVRINFTQAPPVQNLQPASRRNTLLSSVNKRVGLVGNFLTKRMSEISLFRRISNKFSRDGNQHVIQNHVDEHNFLERTTVRRRNYVDFRTINTLHRLEKLDSRLKLLSMGLRLESLFNDNDSMNARPNSQRISKFINIFIPYLSNQLVGKSSDDMNSGGLYISCLLQSNNSVLMTQYNLLPTVRVEFDETYDVEGSLYWLATLITDWSMVRKMKKIIKKEISRSKNAEMDVGGSRDSFPIRLAILNAVTTLQNIAGIEELGQLYYKMFTEGNSTVFLLVNIDLQLPRTSTLFLPILSWIPLAKINSNDLAINNENILSTITKTSKDILLTMRGAIDPKNRGLYVGYLLLSCSMQGLNILVSKQHLSNIPCIKLDGKVASGGGGDSDDDVRAVARYTNVFDEIACTSDQCKEFKKMLSCKCQQLIDDVIITTQPTTCNQSNAADVVDVITSAEHRLYKSTFPLNFHVTMTLLVPPPSLVCPPMMHNQPPHPPSCIFIPLRTFEMLHLNAYQPRVYRKYCQLAAILEVLTEICRRRMILLESSNDQSRDYKMAYLMEMSGQLKGFKWEMDETWSRYRWLADVITQARMTSSQHFVSLDRLF